MTKKVKVNKNIKKEADEFKKEGASDLIPALLLSFQYLFSLIYLA